MKKEGKRSWEEKIGDEELFSDKLTAELVKKSESMTEKEKLDASILMMMDLMK